MSVRECQGEGEKQGSRGSDLQGNRGRLAACGTAGEEHQGRGKQGSVGCKAAGDCSRGAGNRGSWDWKGQRERAAPGERESA